MERSNLNRLLWFHTILYISVSAMAPVSFAGFYIPKREYTFHVHDLAYRNPGKVIGVIALSQHSVLDCDVSNDLVYESDVVAVKLRDDKLVLYQGSSPLPIWDPFGFNEPTWFELNLACSSAGSKTLLPYYEPLTRTHVTLLTTSTLVANGGNDGQTGSAGNDATQVILDAICPHGGYDVIENANAGTALDFIDPNIWLDTITKFEVNTTSNDEFISIRQDGPGKLLTLAFSPDREKSMSLEAFLTCRVRFKGQTDDFVKDVEVTAMVYDVNDSPPTVSRNKLKQLKEHFIGPDKSNVRIFTMDGDSMNVNNYTISTNDSQVLQIGDTRFMGDHYAMTHLQFNDADITRPYFAEVYVDDLNYKPAAGEDIFPYRVVHRLTLQGAPPPKHEVVEAQLDKAATSYSLIINLRDEEEDLNVTFILLNSELMGLVNVTSHGQLYLLDSQKMWDTNDTKIKLDVGRFTEEGRKLNEIAVIVTFTNTRNQEGANQCDASCSTYNDSETCKTACGIGTASGLCSWNFRHERISSYQIPCSPDVTTCPDGYCDELERLHPSVCPQDCEPVVPSKYPHTHIGASTSSRNSRSFLNCGHSCRLAIAAAGAAMTLITALIMFTWLFHRRRENKRRHISALKRSSSVGSVGAIPSDYIVDESHGPPTRIDVRGHRQILTTSPSPPSGQWGSPDTTTSELFDDNWEFPRCDLTLENILGEGEFGQVVKAQAKNMKGHGSNAVVAVKMLKPEASGTEYQDLVSELQVMKEVDHPNVIKLLGVCSQKGPLFLIVEYCELGSLRSFLRASQFRNKGSWDDKKRRLDDELVSNEDVREITISDLFAFAWQIAKGMDYLAGLKIVHRDLAARNVLVTKGLKLKISDFGLSRDVYEMDTYLKMSKGRIPVKWMAPESLYGQVYTTKSDIWSYGIVLWETVTLGASPYPGIPPERLFPLLSTGYRMDKPEECPDELYAIMQKCWKSEPEQRPTFAELVRFLDNILQQNTDYLDLSGENYIDQSSGFDFENKDFLMSRASDNRKLQLETPPPSPDNNNEHKFGSFDKAHTYRNLQLLNSDPDISVTPIIEDEVKVKQEPPVCLTEENEEDPNEFEPETESSRLLNPDLKEHIKGQDLIIPSEDLVSSLKATTCKFDQNQSRYNNDQSRPMVHENLTYV